MKVLDCFTMTTPEWRLTDLSRHLGLDKTQVLRIASSLESGGYLKRHPTTKCYRLGMRLFQLGSVVREHMDLHRIAEPHLQQLASASQETVRLVALDDQGAVCIDAIESSQPLRVFAQPGTRMPWNAGVTGRIIFAYLSPDKQKAILDQGNFKQFTPRTVIAPKAILQQAQHIRAQGYHFSIGDLTEGVGGIAAPLFDDSGQISGAIGIAAPAHRLENHEIEPLIQLVRNAAHSISAELGYESARMVNDRVW